ncbi:MAG: EAL domain-containing protein [Cyanobacteria bacterium P01_H01_bin.119]
MRDSVDSEFDEARSKVSPAAPKDYPESIGLNKVTQEIIKQFAIALFTHKGSTVSQLLVHLSSCMRALDWQSGCSVALLNNRASNIYELYTLFASATVDSDTVDAEQSASAQLPTPEHISLGSGWPGQAMTQGQTLWISDTAMAGVTEPPQPCAGVVKGMRSLLAIPLTFQNRVMGCLTLSHDKAAAYSAQAVTTLRCIAGLVSALLYRIESPTAPALPPFNHRAARLLQNLSQTITRSTDLQLALADMVASICQFIGWEFGEYWQIDAPYRLRYGKEWYAADSAFDTFGECSQYLTFEAGIGLPGRVWLTQTSEWISNLEQEPEVLFLRTQLAADAGFRAAIGIPVIVQGQLMAVVCCFTTARLGINSHQAEFIGSAVKHLEDLLHLKQIEITLRQKEQQLSRLMNALPGIVFRAGADNEWTMQYLSQGCYQLTGYTSEALTSVERRITYNDLTHPDDLPRVITQIRQAVAQRLPYEVEYRICTKSGDEKWLWEKGAGVYDEIGQITGIEGFITEITQLKRTEQALRLSEARYRQQQHFLQLVLDNLPQQIFWKDRKSRYLGCNQAFVDAVGLARPTDVVGLKDRDIPSYTQEEATEFTAQDRRIMAKGQSELDCLEAKCDPQHGLRWLTCHKLPIQAESGEIIGVLGTCEDITSQVINAHSLQKREGYLSALVSLQQYLLTLGQEDKVSEKDWMAMLAPLGHAADASRVYIYRLYTDSVTGKFVRQIAEWSALGVPSTTDLKAFQRIPVTGLFDRWLDCLRAGEAVNQTWEEFTPLQQQMLSESPSNVRSLLLLPLMVNNLLIGIIGFSNCREAVRWENSEVHLLRGASVALSSAYERWQVETALRQAEQNYRSIFENAVEGIFQSTVEGDYHVVNSMLANIYGYDSPAELMASLVNISEQLYVDPDRRLEFVKQMQRHGALRGFESQVYRKDGSIIWISESARAIHDAYGQLMGYEGTVEDITARKQAEAELYHRDRLLQGVASASNRLLAVVDFDAAFDQALAILGEAADADRVYIYQNHIDPVTAEPLMTIMHEWNRSGIAPSLTQPHWHALPYSAHGLMRWYKLFESGQSVSSLVEDLPPSEEKLLALDGILSILMVPIFVAGQLWGYIGFDACRSPRVWTLNEESILVAIAASIGGVLKRQQTEAQMREQAFHDALTGLPNRMLFDQHLPGVIAAAKRHQELLAVMFLDLDRFKTINDTLGHAVGDILLQQATQRMVSVLREEDLIARWGGDEFTLVVPNLSAPDAAAKVAQRLSAALKPAFHLGDQLLHITSSIGIALYPQDGEDMKTLLKNADAAMYRAKEQGRNTFAFYTTTLNARASKRLLIENSLHHALAQNQFLLHYQPQMHLASGKIIKAEALIRWHHPTLGLVSPDIFISIAEENGLIIPIGNWVLRTACQQTAQWHRLGFNHIRTAVNISSRQLQQPDLVEQVVQILLSTGLTPECLELEITETAVMRDVPAAIATLTQLRSIGICIAMDDFGTGYSSLSYLKKFPLQVLKIDRAFVQDLTGNAEDQAMIAAIVALARGLKLNVIAEGVETEAQLELLRSLDCYGIQGYWLSPSLNAEAMTQFLHAARP